MAITANEICSVSSKRQSYDADSRHVQAFESHFGQPVELKNARLVKCVKFVKIEQPKKLTIGSMFKKAAIGCAVIFAFAVPVVAIIGFLLGK